MTIEYRRLVDSLIERVPELLSLQRPETEGARDLPHVVFGSVLTPYLISLLDESGSVAVIRRIFEFIEELANDEDPRVREVIEVELCEQLRGSSEYLEKARPYMGPATLCLCQEIER